VAIFLSYGTLDIHPGKLYNFAIGWVKTPIATDIRYRQNIFGMAKKGKSGASELHRTEGMSCAY